MRKDNIEMKLENKGYKVLNLSVSDDDLSGIHYQEKVSRYEFALCEAVSDLFCKVVSRSSIEPLKLSFAELPDPKETDRKDNGKSSKRTKEDYRSELKSLVETELVGHVNFPMMHICAVDMSAIREDDGTHTFYFTDGIYGFSVRINVPKKGSPKKLEVTDLRPSDPDADKGSDKTKQERLNDKTTDCRDIIKSHREVDVA